jgi:hypothetical protein
MEGDMEDTSGFYKLDGDLLYGHWVVYGPDYTLLREDHTTYTYPVSGWYWFDTEAEARGFFGLPIAPDDLPVYEG